jgi:hypothetical protein
MARRYRSTVVDLATVFAAVPATRNWRCPTILKSMR